MYNIQHTLKLRIYFINELPSLSTKKEWQISLSYHFCHITTPLESFFTIIIFKNFGLKTQVVFNHQFRNNVIQFSIGDPRRAGSARGGSQPGFHSVSPRLRVHLRVQAMQGFLRCEGKHENPPNRRQVLFAFPTSLNLDILIPSVFYTSINKYGDSPYSVKGPVINSTILYKKDSEERDSFQYS